MDRIKRYIGYNNMTEFIDIIVEHKIKSNNDSSYIFIEEGLPNKSDYNMISDVKYIITDNNEINVKVLESILLKYGVSCKRAESICKIINIYTKNERNINKDILANFTAKIITWLKCYFRNSNIDYKIIYLGDIKKHGVYFLLLLCLEGYKIEYFTLKDNDEFLRIKNIDEYSNLIKGEQFCNINDEELKASINSSVNKVKSNNTGSTWNLRDTNSSASNQVLNSGYYTESNFQHDTSGNEENYKQTVDNINKRRLNIENRRDRVQIEEKDFSSFLNDLKEGKIENFYTGFIGSNVDEESYKNLLFDLKNELKKKFKTLEVMNNILPVSNDEFENINKLSENNKSDKIIVYKNLFKDIFADFEPYEKVINEFEQKNKTKQIVENFSLKILIWSIRIKDFILSKDKKSLLYFGSIKTQEIYFLKILKNMGINILYICPYENYNNDLKLIGSFKLSLGNKFYDLNEYPKKFVSEVETVAYKTAQQVDNILYNEETGMYRPYQLNEKSIKSVILKTTLEEIFILWGEKSNYRSGFVNEGENVEIPILFFKLDGVYNDIEKYYDLFSKLKNNKNVELLYGTNFYINQFNNQEYYSTNFLFDSKGNIDVKKLKESKFYKFQYLDKNVQNHIIEKIDELIKCDYLLFSKDNDFKIKVLLTILNLDEKFVKMLQAYNIGAEVPKLILYNNNKDQYTKEDSIIIMFMILMGIDIGLLNPTGYLNIENTVDEKIIPKFKLETVEYNLEIPDRIKNKKEKKSIFKRIFNI